MLAVLSRSSRDDPRSTTSSGTWRARSRFRKVCGYVLATWLVSTPCVEMARPRSATSPLLPLNRAHAGAHKQYSLNS